MLLFVDAQNFNTLGQDSTLGMTLGPLLDGFPGNPSNQQGNCIQLTAKNWTPDIRKHLKPGIFVSGL